MFTDMKGFTTRTSAQSRSEVEKLLDIHDSVVRPTFAEFNGRIVKTIGDAFLVLFESPTNAVLCGVNIQQKVKEHNKNNAVEDQFEIRIAINAGEVHLKDDDVFGEAVNITSRIEAISEPGEVYFTEAVYLTMNKNEIPSSEVGFRFLKGIPDQVKVYKVLSENSIEDLKLERKLLAEKTGKLSKDENHGSTSESKAEPKKVESSFSKTSFGLNRNIIIASVIALIIVILIGVLAFTFLNKPANITKVVATKKVETEDQSVLSSEDSSLQKDLENMIIANKYDELQKKFDGLSEDQLASCKPALCFTFAKVSQYLSLKPKSFRFLIKVFNSKDQKLKESGYDLALEFLKNEDPAAPESQETRKFVKENLSPEFQNTVVKCLLSTYFYQSDSCYAILIEQKNYPIPELTRYFQNKLYNYNQDPELAVILKSLELLPSGEKKQVVDNLKSYFKQSPDDYPELILRLGKI